jgi:hypothetical protein
MKVQVTTRALVQRINRLLAKDDQMLKKTREKSRWFSETGEYFIINFNQNAIVAKHVDLEKLGRELGALKDYEEIEG